MVREALVQELAGRLTKLLQDIEGADKLSLSDLMRVITLSLNQIHGNRKEKSCRSCDHPPSRRGEPDPLV